MTHAQLSVAVAGFSGVAAAIRRPLTPLLRQRFLALLSVSFQQVLACKLPIWLSGFIPDLLWGHLLAQMMVGGSQVPGSTLKVVLITPPKRGPAYLPELGDSFALSVAASDAIVDPGATIPIPDDDTPSAMLMPARR